MLVEHALIDGEEDLFRDLVVQVGPGVASGIQTAEVLLTVHQEDLAAVPV